ncbi:MAG: hypothetical protein Q7K42_05385, partial [Candidatus Diapherotrites archaeon]|nr:hypothetical protein [Candidatus Diapherotrites archaeon]
MANEVSFIDTMLALSVNVLTIFALILIAKHAINSTNLQKEEKNSMLAKISAFLIVWFALFALLAYFGFFNVTKQTFFPLIALGVGVPIILGWFALKKFKSLQKVLEKAPMHWLIGIQIYRNLGIVFLTLYSQGLLPGLFALPTGYGDLLIGLTAPIVAIIYYLKHSSAKILAILWNILGIIDLTIAIGVGFFAADSIVKVFYT